MKITSATSLSLFVVWVLIVIFDMWFDIISWEVFIKLTVTLGLLAVVALGIALAKREYVDEKQTKIDKDID